MSTTTEQGFNPFGLGSFNSQSGFGNLNDAADSIGSLFGFGPEDRNSVLTRGRSELQPLLTSIMRIHDATGLQKSLAMIDSSIAKKVAKKKTFRSSNSKAKEQQDIDLLKELRVSLIASDELEITNTSTSFGSISDQSQSGSGQSSNTMFLGIGAIILLLTKFTKILK